jgi:hypothetical protein
MFKGSELSTLYSWIQNGYQVAMGRLKELYAVTEIGTAKAGSLMSGLGTSQDFFLILYFCLSFSVLRSLQSEVHG